MSDIQGLAQGVLGVAGLAESVQGDVCTSVAAAFGPFGARFIDKSLGSSGVKMLSITGLMYGDDKGITRLAGGTVSAALARVVPFVNARFGVQAPSPQREAVLAALNGALGDYLLSTANPLAITTSLRRQGHALPMDQQALAKRLPHATGKILIVAHGLCMNDLQWRVPEKLGKNGVASSHPEVLARKMSYTPVDLYYNTGLHNLVNGQHLAVLLEQLLQAWPQPVQELNLLVRSMGGWWRAVPVAMLKKPGRPGASI